MSNYCIYRHIRLDTNQVFYIGIGNTKRPYSKHRTIFWKNITNKTNYEVQILKYNLSWEEAKELEVILISWYGRRDLGLGNLVNLTDGGEGHSGYKQSQETILKRTAKTKGRVTSELTKQKQSISSIKSMTTEVRKKISLANTGKKRSEESKLKMKKAKENISDITKKRMSLSATGRKLSEETKEKFRQRMLTNHPNKKSVICIKTLKVWSSVTNCAKENNIQRVTLTKYLLNSLPNKTTFIYERNYIPAS